MKSRESFMLEEGCRMQDVVVIVPEVKQRPERRTE